MKIEEKIAIQELNYCYALHIDLKQIDEWVNVFSPDGILDEREFGFGLHSGRDEMREYALKLTSNVITQVHLMTNHLISEIGPAEARGTVFALVESLTHSRGHMRFHLYYEDEYMKLGSEWKIRKRLLRKTLPPVVISKPS